jgi:hypothetical protein
MLMKEFVNGLITDDAVAAKLDRKTVRAITTAVLEQVRKYIDEVDEGRVVIPALGAFAIKQVVRAKDGQDVTVKRISLKPRAERDPGAAT